MAKVLITIEDAVKDGQTQVLGQFKTEGQNPPENGLPGEVTPAELYTVCLQRLWDAGLMNGFVTLVCADILFRNDQVRQRRAAAQVEKAVPNLPEGLPQRARPDMEDAVVIQPDAPEAPPEGTTIDDLAARVDATAGKLDDLQARINASAEPLPAEPLPAEPLPAEPLPAEPLPEGAPTHLPDGTPVRVVTGSGDAKGLAW